MIENPYGVFEGWFLISKGEKVCFLSSLLSPVGTLERTTKERLG